MVTDHILPTVRGPILTTELGRVLMHEHIFILTMDYMVNFPQRQGFDERRYVRSAIDKLNELKELGIDSIVDLTVLGMGRDISRIQKVAEEVDLNIVVATGIYTYDSLPMPFHFQGPGCEFEMPEPLIDMFVNDIENGIGDTKVRAGILKCAIDTPGLTPGVERVLRACARSSVLTGGTPISTHTHAGTKGGVAQVNLFREEGVDLSRVVIGHSGDSLDIDYLTWLMSNGVYIGMDRFRPESIPSTDERVGIVAELCRQGFSKQIVMSHDACVFNDYLPPGDDRAAGLYGDFAFISRVVLPKLEDHGIGGDVVDDILVHNPRRIFRGCS